MREKEGLYSDIEVCFERSSIAMLLASASLLFCYIYGRVAGSFDDGGCCSYVGRYVRTCTCMYVHQG